MTEVAIGSVLAVADRLYRTVSRKAEVLSEVETRVEWIDRELRLMQASLEHIERTTTGTEQGFSEWAEELKSVALEAEDAIGTFDIRSVKRKRKWIFFWVDRYDIGKELDQIKEKMYRISQEGMKFFHQSRHQDMERGVVAAKDDESSRPALALKSLNSVLASKNLDNSLKQILQELRDDLASIQRIMSNLRPVEKPFADERLWLNEVDVVCVDVTEATDRFDKITQMQWQPRLWLELFVFTLMMEPVKVRTKEALRRWFTYGIGKEEGAGLEKSIVTSGEVALWWPKILSKTLKGFIIRRLICYVFYLGFFSLMDILHLSPTLVVAFFMIVALLALAASIIVDLLKATEKKFTRRLGVTLFLDHLCNFFLLYLVPVTLVIGLVSVLFLGDTILWVLSLPNIMGVEINCVGRELAIMDAFLKCVEGENERQRIWIKQIRAVTEQAKPLVAEYEHEMNRYKQATVLGKLMQLYHLHELSKSIDDMLLKMRSISERKINYCIPNIEKREELAFSLGQSTQRNDDSISDGVEEPLLSAAGSNSYLASVRGLKLHRQVESIKEERQLMEALFKDAQEMGELEDRCKIWVDEVRDIASSIKYVRKEYKSRLEGKAFHAYLRHYHARSFMESMINHIRNNIRDSSRRRNAYGVFGLQACAGSSTSVVQQSQPLDTMKVPLYLRRCLFYFVLFPDKFKIPAKRLVALWVAEGLVHQGANKKSPEQVAKSYLKELIKRGMVETADKKPNGEVNTCFLRHDLREKWLKIANESRFLQRTNVSDDSDSVPNKPIIHRLVDNLDINDPWHHDIHSGNPTTDPATQKASYEDVVLLLSFDTKEGSKPGKEIGKFLDRCISSGCFLLLRVLDLEGVYKPQLPENIGKLYRLRYLGLRWTYLESLPSSVRKLLKLQTLDLKYTYINILTSSIWKMELRLLILSENYRTRFPPQPKHNYLSNLQTLSGLFVDEETPVKGGLDNLVNIKKLGLTCQSMSPEPDAMKSQHEAVADWIMKLEHLQSLRLNSRDIKGKPSNLHLKSLKEHKCLTKMYLLGRLSDPSILRQFPPSLSDLTLSHSNLSDDPMQYLEHLHNLWSLYLLAGCYTGKTMTFSHRSFQQLIVLKLWKLEQLEELNIEKKALPHLRRVEIRSRERPKIKPPDRLKGVTINYVNDRETCKWEFPPKGFVCLNSKGSTKDNSKVACGGLIRDWAGAVLGGFCLNLEAIFLNLEVPSEFAELWGVLHGLNYAQKMGLKKVRVDIDSPNAFSLIPNPYSNNSYSHKSHLMLTVIQGINDLRTRDWTLEFRLISCEANRVANRLADMGHGQPLSVLEFISPPTCLAEVIGNDQDLPA